VDHPDVRSSYGFSGYAVDEVEHTIGTVRVDRAVETTFTISVETPDPDLEEAEPRFMLVGAYDYAALPYGGVLLLGRDLAAGGAGLLLLAFGLTVVWRRSRG
jgi:hypothetical protein